MTLTQFFNKDGYMIGSIKTLQFTAHIIKIKNCTWKDHRELPGDYWIEKVIRMGTNEHPYFKLELQRCTIQGNHQTVNLLDQAEIYCSIDDFDKLVVEVT